MNVRVERDARIELQEAIREIEVMAGLTELRQPVVEAAELGLASGGTNLPMTPEPPAPLLHMRMRPQTHATVHQELPHSTPRPLAIGITSAHGHEGKTTISIALASSLAADLGAQVMLVDADFRTQSLARIYGLEGKRGLADVISGGAPVGAAVHRYLRSPLGVVPAGEMFGDSARVARSERLAAFLESLKAMSGFVVLDLPATLASMDAPVLAQRCDGVIVVVRAGQTTRQDLERQLALLKDANVLGIVVNRYRTAVPGMVERMLGLAR